MAKRNNKKSKFHPGTWLERELFTSRAYLELRGFAPQLLVLFLAKREFDKDKKVRNKDSLTMTYIELENFYHRREVSREACQLSDQRGLPSGISRPRIIRAIEQLLAHGFIKIVRRGGAYQQDKTIYALVDDWKRWWPGMVFRKREPDTRKRGYNGKNIKIAHETVPVHTNEIVPIGGQNDNVLDNETVPTAWA